MKHETRCHILMKKILDKYFINGNFLLIIFGGFISGIGSKMYQIVVMWWIYQHTNSSGIVGIFMIASYLPGMILSIFCGMLVDRINRKNIIVTMDFARGILMLIISVLFINRIFNIIYLVIATIMISICDVMFDPAINAMIKSVLDHNTLKKGNSINVLSKNLYKLLGPLIGGFLMLKVNVEYIILINGISYILSAVSELFIKVNEEHIVKSKEDNKSIKNNFKVIFEFFKSRKMITQIIVTISIVNFFTCSTYIILPGLIKDIGFEAINYSLLLSAMSCGSFFSAFIISIQKSDNESINTSKSQLSKSILLYGIAMMAFSLCNNFPIMMISYFVIGGANTVFNIVLMSLLQSEISSKSFGKIFSFISTISLILSPISNLVFGFLGNEMKKTMIFLVIAIVLLLAGIYIRFIKEEELEEKLNV